MPLDFNKNVLEQLLQNLYELNIQSLIVEGGAHTLQEFINQNLWDEARLFSGKAQLSEGIKAPRFEFSPMSTQTIVDDCLKIFKK